MNMGWIKTHRDVLEYSFSSRPSYLALWLRLLLMATHSPRKFLFNGEEVYLNPGQLITGRKKLAEVSGIKESTVQNILKWLENNHYITQKTCSKNRLITIVDWDKMQGAKHHFKQQMNRRETPECQPRNTNKNDNNEKKEKNIKNVAYEKSFTDICNLWEKKAGQKLSDKDKQGAYSKWKVLFSSNRELSASDIIYLLEHQPQREGRNFVNLALFLHQMTRLHARESEFSRILELRGKDVI